MKRSFYIAAAVACLCLASLPALGAAEGSFQRTLKVDGPVNLDIETGSGSIEVRPGGSGEVRIYGKIKVFDWFGSSDEKVKRLEANPPLQQSGNLIRVGHISDPSLRRNVSISYEVVVPADTRLRAQSGSGSQTVRGIRGPVDLETGSGSQKVSQIGGGLRAHSGSGSQELDGIQGNVHARTGSGSIHASNVQGGFDGEAGSGDISLEQTAPGAVRVDTGSGGVQLRGVRGSLEAKTGSGTIEAQGDPSGAWNLQTGSGSVRLQLAANAAFDLNAHTGSGSIRLDHPVTVQGTIGKKEIRGKVRGGGVPVEIGTGSGSIDIR